MPNDTIDTEKQEQDLFLEISKAIREDDHATLDRLVTSEEPKEEEKVVEEEVVPKEEESVVKETVKEETKDDGEQEEEAPKEAVDELTKLREELEAQRTLNHKLKSDAGRVPSLQRKLAEVDKQLREMSAKTNPSAATTREDKRVLSEKLAQIKEHDPLLADAVMDIVNDAISELRQDLEPKVAAAEKAVFTKEMEETLETEMQKLEAVVPNAMEVFQSPAWTAWKADLPATWRALAESAYAEDVLVALQRYSKDIYERHPELKPADTSKQTTTTAPVNEEATRVQQQRDKKLTTKTPGTASVSAKDTPNLDEDALFASVYAAEAAKFKRPSAN